MSSLTTHRATVEVSQPSPYLEGQVPVYRDFRNRKVQSKVKPMSKSKVRVRESLYGCQSVSPYVLASSPLCGCLTRYFFLFKYLGLEFLVLSLWNALSDKRPGLSFVSHSLVICLCAHLLFTFLSFTPLPYNT
jgi:hypothetical protein